MAEGGIGQAPLFPDLLEQAGGGGTAEQVADDGGGVVIVVAHAHAGKAQADMVLLDVLFDEGLAAGVFRFRQRRQLLCAAVQAAEVFFRQLSPLLRADVARQGQHRVLRGIAGAPVSVQLGPAEGGDASRRAGDGAAVGVAGPEGGGEQVQHQLVRAVLVHIDLFDHHAPLPLQFVFVQQGAAVHIAEQVQRQLQIFVQGFRVIAGLLLGGEGVQDAAHVVHGGGKLQGIAGGRALEQHVLQQMRNAPLLGCLPGGAGIGPHAGGNGAQMGHIFQQQPQAVAKDVFFGHKGTSPN